MEEKIKSLHERNNQSKKVEPDIETLKKHINDYQLILGKEEDKIHELQNHLYMEKNKNKDMMEKFVK